MIKSLTTAVSVALWAASATVASAGDLTKQIAMLPGKGVTFYMGAQQGIAVFKPEDGACGLTMTFAQAPAAGTEGMSGMAGGMSGMDGAKKGATVRMEVMTARPARVDTADGQQLIFNCGPEAKAMYLNMPTDLKYKD